MVHLDETIFLEGLITVQYSAIPFLSCLIVMIFTFVRVIKHCKSDFLPSRPDESFQSSRLMNFVANREIHNFRRVPGSGLEGGIEILMFFNCHILRLSFAVDVLDYVCKILQNYQDFRFFRCQNLKNL